MAIGISLFRMIYRDWFTGFSIDRCRVRYHPIALQESVRQPQRQIFHLVLARSFLLRLAMSRSVTFNYLMTKKVNFAVSLTPIAQNSRHHRPFMTKENRISTFLEWFRKLNGFKRNVGISIDCGFWGAVIVITLIRKAWVSNEAQNDEYKACDSRSNCVQSKLILTKNHDEVITLNID